MNHKRLVWKTEKDNTLVVTDSIFGELGLWIMSNGSVRVYYGNMKNNPETIANKSVEELKEELQTLCDKAVDSWFDFEDIHA